MAGLLDLRNSHVDVYAKILVGPFLYVRIYYLMFFWGDTHKNLETYHPKHMHCVANSPGVVKVTDVLNTFPIVFFQTATQKKRKPNGNQELVSRLCFGDDRSLLAAAARFSVAAILATLQSTGYSYNIEATEHIPKTPGGFLDVFK